MKLKWPEVPDFPLSTVRAVSMGCGFLCLGFGVADAALDRISWASMYYTALGGWLLGGAFWMGRVIRMEESFNELVDAFRRMREFTDALIQDKVEMHFMGERPEDEHPKPKLH